MEFKFNSSAKYTSGSVYSVGKATEILTQPKIYVSESKWFQANLLNVFTKYTLPYVRSEQIVNSWSSDQMNFWQQQLNFAVWCATTGCGISKTDHLQFHNESLSISLFRFHTYYQIRRILSDLKCPLPQDSFWHPFKNSYDRRAYERICTEFNVSINTDWRQKQSTDDGLGAPYNYWTGSGYHMFGNAYDSSRMSFTGNTTNEKVHVNYVSQGLEANEAWTTFILDQSKGFTQPGVERLNDSIRTYVWTLLAAQSQTRTNIIGTGTAFDAQKQYHTDLEDAINSPTDLQGSIKRFEDTLRYASSKVDYVFGVGLYMAPSDLELKIGRINNYNNNIVIATETEELGFNANLNSVHSQTKASEIIKETTPIIKTTKPPTPKHEDEKTALIVGSITVGLLTLWIFKSSF